MKNNIQFLKILPPALWCLLLLTACATTERTSNRLSADAPAIIAAQPASAKKLVAVAGFENRSTFMADKLWDTCSQLLSTRLIGMGYFRVVEWERMKQLFDWDALSTSSLVKMPEQRTQARQILLCEYFLTGAITFFDVHQTAEVSAFSRSKVLDTTVRVDLLLQDAMTGEYLAASTAEAMETKEYKGGPMGGETGSWDSRSADRALDSAIQKALVTLVTQYENQVAGGLK
jgi:curli biogenesis system outer membrane secretion channel CsgG